MRLRPGTTAEGEPLLSVERNVQLEFEDSLGLVRVNGPLTSSGFSLRSWRKHKAWGVSPRVNTHQISSPRMRATERTRQKVKGMCDQRTVAHFMGSQFNFDFDPGAYAPRLYAFARFAGLELICAKSCSALIY